MSDFQAYLRVLDETHPVGLTTGGFLTIQIRNSMWKRKPDRRGDHVHSTRSRLPRHKRLARHQRRHRHDPTRVAQLHATKLRRRHVEAMHACFDAAWARRRTGLWANLTRERRASDRP